jgi:hypothetical protein
LNCVAQGSTRRSVRFDAHPVTPREMYYGIHG